MQPLRCISVLCSSLFLPLRVHVNLCSSHWSHHKGDMKKSVTWKLNAPLPQVLAIKFQEAWSRPSVLLLRPDQIVWCGLVLPRTEYYQQKYCSYNIKIVTNHTIFVHNSVWIHPRYCLALCILRITKFNFSGVLPCDQSLVATDTLFKNWKEIYTIFNISESNLMF